MEKHLCECGCGNSAPIAKLTKKSLGHIKGFPMRFISHHNCMIGEKAPRWKGGRRKTTDGYDLIYRPNHPGAQSNGCILGHRLVAELAFGKPLPNNIPVHHHDEIQLVICQDDPYHKLLHQRMRALRASGHANWRKCWICKKYDAPENMVKNNLGTNAHLQCRNEHVREYRANRKRRLICQSSLKATIFES